MLFKFDCVIKVCGFDNWAGVITDTDVFPILHFWDLLYI